MKPIEIKIKPAAEQPEKLWPDIATERRNKFNQKVRDCPKCKADMTRKFT